MMAKKEPPKRKMQRSTVGTPNPKVDQSKWRKKMLQYRIKFDDERKEIFLREIAKHGRRGTACEAVDITPNTVYSHLEADPVFAEAFKVALESYRDKFISHTQNLMLDGIERKRYNAKGEVVEVTREYPTNLIAMEMRRIEPGYRDRQQVDVEVKGGVLVVPATISPNQWIEANRAKVTDEKGEALLLEAPEDVQ